MTIPITYGDATLGRPFEATWISGADTIVLKVYKKSADDTPEYWMERILEGVSTAFEEYPPGS